MNAIGCCILQYALLRGIALCKLDPLHEQSLQANSTCIRRKQMKALICHVRFGMHSPMVFKKLSRVGDADFAWVLLSCAQFPAQDGPQLPFKLRFEILGFVRSDRASGMESTTETTRGTTTTKRFHLVDGKVHVVRHLLVAMKHRLCAIKSKRRLSKGSESVFFHKNGN